MYDYKFEKLWEEPDKWVEHLKPYKAVLTPDFSMYLEMPDSVKLFNTFRNRWCGAYMAEKELRVIPTVNWGGPSSFDFCFEGIQKGSVVAVSTYMASEHGNHADQKTFLWRDTMRCSDLWYTGTQGRVCVRLSGRKGIRRCLWRTVDS